MIPNFVNLVLCVAFGWSAMCRLSLMHKRVRLAPSLLYVGLFAVSVLSGLQFFLFGSLATWGEVMLAALVCALLCVTVPHWRSGPPRHVLRLDDPAL